MMDTLSPRRLVGWLSPAISLDAEVIDGWLLSDCYRLSDSEPVRLELSRGQQRFEIDVQPAPEQASHRPLALVAGLELGYRASAPAEPATAACKRIAECLRASLGDAPRRWQLAAPSLLELIEPVAAELRSEPTALDADPDHAILAHDFANYERLYGARPQALAVRVLDQPAHGVSVFYPSPRNGRTPNSTAVYPTPLRIAHRRRMRLYFGRMGYLFDEHTTLRTTPTPTTYARALAGRSDVAGIRPRMVAGVSASLRPVHWGMFVRRNILPVTVAPNYSVAIHQRIRDIGPTKNIPCDVGAVTHDMGLHALAVHAIPEAAWQQILELAFARVLRRPLSVLAGPYGVLWRLAQFFEGPLTTHGWKAWAEVDEPEDYARCFAPHLDQLLDELRAI